MRKQFKNMKQEVQNFCNQYRMSKISLQLTQTTPYNHKPKKKPHKSNKFEKPKQKRQQNFQSQTPKAKKKKFQRNNNKREASPIRHPNQSTHNDGYESIEKLLQNLTSPSTSTNTFQTNINYKSKPDYSFNNEQCFTDRPSYTSYQPNNSYSPINAFKTKSHIFQENAYSKFFQNKSYHYENYEEKSNYSSKSYNMRESDLKRENLGERSFYLPISKNNNQETYQKQQRQKSQGKKVSNISSLLSKFSKEITNKDNQRKMSQIRNQGKGQNFFRNDSKNDFDDIQLNQNIRNDLTYLSQARIPPKPITVQIRQEK